MRWTGRARARSRLLAGVLIVLAAAPVLHRYLVAWPQDQWLVDLEVYREAGRSVLVGRPVYEVLTQPPQLLPFTYTPVAAILAVPLAVVPFLWAGWLWSVLQVAALAVVTWYAGRPLWASLASRFGPDAGVLGWGLVTAPMLWLHPVGDGIRFGQVGIVLMLLVVLDLRPRGEGEGVLSRLLDRIPPGALIGLAIAIKLTPGVFLLALLALRRWRAASWATGVAAALTVGAFLARPGDSVAFWFGALLDPTRLGYNGGTANQSLRGWLLRSGPDGLAGSLVWLALVAAVLAAGWWVVRRLDAAGEWVAVTATAGVVGGLISPVSWIHHWVWVVLVVLALLGAAPAWFSGMPPWRGVAAAAVMLWYWARLPWWGVTWLLTTDRPRVIGQLLKNADVLGGVLLLALLALLATRPGVRAPATAERDPRKTPDVSGRCATR